MLPSLTTDLVNKHGNDKAPEVKSIRRSVEKKTLKKRGLRDLREKGIFPEDKKEVHGERIVYKTAGTGDMLASIRYYYHDNTAYLGHIKVIKPLQQQHIGTELVTEELFKTLRSEDVDTVYALAKSKDGVGLLESLGFTISEYGGSWYKYEL